MVETLFAASMQVTGTAHNSQGQSKWGDIGSRERFTVREMCVTWKSKCKATVAGSRRAQSKRRPWPSTLPPKLTETSGEEGSGELRLAVRSGQDFGRAGQELF